MTAPSKDMRTLLERMPWRGKFTREQVGIIEARLPRIVDAMTDAVGVFGQVLYIPPDVLHLLAAHVALAGDFFDDGAGQFIEYRIRDVESPSGEIVVKDIREWRKVGEFPDEPPPPAEEPDTEEMVERMKRLPKHVRRRALAAFVAEFEAATQDDDEDDKEQ